MKYGKLTIIDVVENIDQRKAVLCKCDCGVTCTKLLKSLKSGNTKSCGCYRKQWTIEHNIKYTFSRNRLYSIWSGIKRRCYNENCYAYRNYGGKGILMCEDWNNNFIFFEDWAYNNGYSDELTIERIDNEKGYEPSNCTWIPKGEQSKNRTSNNYLEYNGEIKTLTDWSKYLGVTRNKIYYYLNKGLTLQDMVEKGIITIKDK